MFDLHIYDILSGLYLVKLIDMDKSFNPSPQLRSYMERAMQKEKEILKKTQNLKVTNNLVMKLCHYYF